MMNEIYYTYKHLFIGMNDISALCTSMKIKSERICAIFQRVPSILVIE